jgi:hypothetical protein
MCVGVDLVVYTQLMFMCQDMSVTMYKVCKHKTTFTKATHRHRKCDKFRLRIASIQGLKIVLLLCLLYFSIRTS